MQTGFKNLVVASSQRTGNEALVDSPLARVVFLGCSGLLQVPWQKAKAGRTMADLVIMYENQGYNFRNGAGTINEYMNTHDNNSLDFSQFRT